MVSVSKILSGDSVGSGSSLRAGHPISRVATLRCSGTDAVAVVCAGGSCVSVQPAPRWLTSSLAGSGAAARVNGGLGAATGASSSSPLGMVNCMAGEPLSSVPGQEVGKGAAALLAAVQQWSLVGHLHGSRDCVALTCEPAATTTTSPLSSEQRVTLSAGAVTCLSVASLPGSTDTAVAVVGTTVGTVALLLIEGSRSVYKVAECALAQWSSGAITAQDAVVDVAFSMDPAGRPEFVSAASTGCVVVVDVQLFYREPLNDGLIADEEVGGAATDAPAREVHRTGWRQETEPWSNSALRAKAVEALERSSAQLVRRSCSDVFACFFVEADVVRIFAPQRLQAAAAMDVALVVVLSSGALHYVERVVEGGSVRLLAEYHRLRLAKGSTFMSHTLAEGQGDDGGAASDNGMDGASLRLLTDNRAVPHVIYRYRLSPYQIQACQDGSPQMASGPGGSCGMAALATESVTHVCDAHLHFSERDAAFHVVLAGTQRMPHSKGGYMSPASRVGSLGHVQQHSKVTGYRACGWWAVVQNVVLHRQTFDRAALERQAVEQLRRQQPQPCDERTASALSTNAVSPFTVRVQSNTMALPSGIGASPASLSASALTSPASPSPAAAGASADQGNGFAVILMNEDVLFLASGRDLYVGDLRDVPPSAKALPMLRPLRSFGSVVEGVAVGPYVDARAVLVATGSCVTPVSLI
ncbi:hypothetical protein JKF63_06876 [Porcisia hertigi]|uniref:Uncharacterized protein n=1 Tax=Porcisia hertigi TaxID=2761500 RepID=A0A836LJ98_9TRYP|nr:hypothetical protein JKF63_06876 [Porcisia hertigi]